MVDRAQPGARVPGGIWGLVMGGVLAVAVIVAGGALALALGAADPPLDGPALWQDRASAWAGGPEAQLAAGADRWFVASDEARLPEGIFTLKARATLAASGDPSAAWGVWIAQNDGSRILWAISGEGYVTTRICPGDALLPVAVEDCPAARPDWRWMPYNRIRAPGEANEIALHRDDQGAIRLWLNRERLGIMDVQPGGAWGLWARGGRTGAAILTWAQAGIYAGD